MTVATTPNKPLHLTRRAGRLLGVHCSRARRAGERSVRRQREQWMDEMAEFIRSYTVKRRSP
jgi:hypothetical protein